MEYWRRVHDTKVLGTVKVGDKVDIVRTEALWLSLDAPKK